MNKLPVVLFVLIFTTSTVGAVTTNAVNLDGDEVSIADEMRGGTAVFSSDTDSDGLADGAEADYGSNPTAADTDDDGLDDGTEVEQGSNPAQADTDGDGLDDGAEIDAGTDPTDGDTDGDGLTDAIEVDGTSDPTVADTDDDGLDDGTEVEFGSDPTVTDTDDDGLDDAVEQRHGSDPRATDSDDDGLDDGAEPGYRTDPVDADTDGDGLDDGTEVDGPTDPFSRDTDFDQLADGREKEVGTDPTNPDTDGDNLKDGWEVDEESLNGAKLPNADPLHMNLYVQLNHEQNSKPLTGLEKKYIREAWAGMDVENPDGETGIRIHFDDQGELEESISVVPDEEFYELRTKYYSYEHLGSRKGVYHLMLLVRVQQAGGVGDGGGHFAITDSVHESVRRDIVIHELLHNVMGELDEENQCGSDRGHSCSGWLKSSGGTGMTEGLLEELERDGFVG